MSFGQLCSEGMDSLAGQDGAEKNGERVADKEQGIAFGRMPLGEQVVDPDIQEPGQQVALEHAAAEPGQEPLRAAGEPQTVDAEEEHSHQDRGQEAAVAALDEAVGEDPACGGEGGQQTHQSGGQDCAQKADPARDVQLQPPDHRAKSVVGQGIQPRPVFRQQVDGRCRGQSRQGRHGQRQPQQLPPVHMVHGQIQHGTQQDQAHIHPDIPAVAVKGEEPVDPLQETVLLAVQEMPDWVGDQAGQSVARQHRPQPVVVAPVPGLFCLQIAGHQHEHPVAGGKQPPDHVGEKHGKPLDLAVKAVIEEAVESRYEKQSQTPVQIDAGFPFAHMPTS